MPSTLCSDAIISAKYLHLKCLVAGLSLQKAQEKLHTAKAHETVVACEDSPHNVTLSGKAADMLNQHFRKDGLSCQYVLSCHVGDS